MVSRPTEVGGLGFGMKWNMGWMHDTLKYFSRDPLYRKYHHNELTFSIYYAFTENFLLPLSHDEVVYGKGSLLRKMPGDEWQRFANLRALFGYMYTHPGKKLLFMGGEFGQWDEWNHEQQLAWHLDQHPLHHGVQRWLKDLHATYRSEAALWQQDFSGSGFEWIDCTDSDNSVLSYIRIDEANERPVLIVINFTPTPRHNYRVGVPRPGYWKELLNSDAAFYGGSGQGNYGGVQSVPVSAHGRYHAVSLNLPPLGALVFGSAPSGNQRGS
jgi:1,4-alpha-glucan branching enzyme